MGGGGSKVVDSKKEKYIKTVYISSSMNNTDDFDEPEVIVPSSVQSKSVKSKIVKKKENKGSSKEFEDKSNPKVVMSDEQKQIVIDCFVANHLMHDTEKETFDLLTVSMVKETIKGEGVYLCTEGEEEDKLYIVESGELEVFSDKKGSMSSLEKGMLFGELSLLFQNPRLESVRTLSETTVVWSLRRDAFKKILSQSQHNDNLWRLSRLAAIPELQQMGPEKRFELCSLLHTKVFDAGSFLFKTDEACYTVMLSKSFI